MAEKFNRLGDFRPREEDARPPVPEAAHPQEAMLISTIKSVSAFLSVLSGRIRVILVTNRAFVLNAGVPTFQAVLSNNITYWEAFVQNGNVQYGQQFPQLPVLNQGDSFMYVHGYNNTTEDAVLSAAKVGRGVVAANIICFSWPSVAHWYGYPADVNTATASLGQLMYVINTIRGQPNQTLHLLSHSLGNSMIIAVLQHILQNAPNQAVIFGHLFFAAADVSFNAFVAALDAIAPHARSISNYVCDSDAALAFSSFYNWSQRAGRYPPISHSNATPRRYVTLLWEGFVGPYGHSYYKEALAIDDMKDVIHDEPRQLPVFNRTDKVYFIHH